MESELLSLVQKICSADY
ncbi:hypothetical protein [Enterobacter hormaechei]|nr:hypothetical protein [Enterobacter hormaechei]MCU6187746.1 hypothetical protein [Enterobacter bugandensis]HAV1783333.1 hypothetical protein [Enterobacter hormaechei subsp. steigerwaltii]HAV1785991.1 hypothetical protein [Enterobacter hormaechei subsp. steigerwaltii]HAV1797803.1 hypothetical protein [Enterobacter hormaechei subsp. steigerwaltii]